jgi:hypothetical protein
MLPARPVDLAARPAEHRVVHRHPQFPARRDQQRDGEPGDAQAELVRVPAGPREEVVRPVMRPQPLQGRPQQHPGDGPPARLAGQPGDQAAERGEARRGETRPQRAQDFQQRAG